MEFRVHYGKTSVRRRERWWWTLAAGNGRTIAESGEKYVNRADMMQAMEQTMLADETTPIVEPL